ncbi:MAG: histidine triad nucleotide-binding protein [Clostridia bacterium]|nr:histidine triad nucleotide-binding protein [Clostridia bacterium]
MEDCIFCKIANGEIPTNMVYEDELVAAFNDMNPAAPIHILIVPKAHISSALELDETNSAVVGHIFEVAGKIAREQGFDEDGFRLVNNCGRDGGQTVGHLHFHLLAGRYLEWPPG